MNLKLSILIILMLIGSAYGQSSWYPRAVNLTTTGDVNADNGVFTGDLTVMGTISATGGTVNSGVYDGNFRLAAGHILYSTAGSGYIDWANATGTNQFNNSDFINDVDIDNTLQVGGNTQVASFTDNSTAGIHGGLSLDGYLYGNGISKLKSLTINESLGVHTTAKFDNNVQVEDALSGGTLLVNRTSVLTGVTTMGLTNQSTILQQSNTTLVSSTAKRMYRLKAPSAHVGLTIVLPPVAEMNNTVLTFVNELAVTNSCAVTLDGSGAETINGAATVYCTAKYAAISLYCIDGEWINVSSSGTWT